MSNGPAERDARDHPEPRDDLREDDRPEDEGRREALRAVQKYAAFVAGTSTVVLSADEAVAQQDLCSILDPNQTPWLYYWFCGGDRPRPWWTSRGGFRPAQRLQQRRGVERYTRPSGIGSRN